MRADGHAHVPRRIAGARPLLRDALERGVDARLIDSALALASRLFVAVIPLARLVTALLPGRRDVQPAPRRRHATGRRGAPGFVIYVGATFALTDTSGGWLRDIVRPAVAPLYISRPASSSAEHYGVVGFALRS